MNYGDLLLTNGSSGALKLANNHLIGLMTAVWGESVAIAQRGGVDSKLALEMFAGTFGRVAEMSPTLLEGDFTPHFTLDALVKDIRALLDASDATMKRWRYCARHSRFTSVHSQADTAARTSRSS